VDFYELLSKWSPRIQTYLSRSGSYPLSVELLLGSVSPALEIILSTSRRWIHLKLRLYSGIPLPLLALENNLPLLQRLEIDGADLLSRDHTLFKSVPSLRYMVITFSRVMDSNGCDMIMQVFPLTSLHQLQLQLRNDLSTVLSQCQTLTALSLRGETSLTKPIQLPALKKLDLTNINRDQSFKASKMTLPSLESLAVCANQRHLYDILSSQYHHLTSLKLKLSQYSRTLCEEIRKALQSWKAFVWWRPLRPFIFTWLIFFGVFLIQERDQ
jgi:hypothetical protein